MISATTALHDPAPARAGAARGAGTRVGTPVRKALASTTRAAIFDRLRAGGEELTVRDVAGDFELHPNVARTHLELLADAGLVAVGRRKHPGGGRPAKVYRARADLEQLDTLDAEQTADAATGGDTLLVGLLTALLPDDDRAGGRPLTERAHDVALASGRRLVAEAGVERTHDLAEAAAAAVRVLRRHASELRILRSGDDWVDVVGGRATFPSLAAERPDLADIIARGLVTGALAAAGVRAVLAQAPGASGAEQVWRVRVGPPASSRATLVPAATVDARGTQRERGVVQAMRTVTRLRGGEVLEVLAEGPGSPAAFARWADRAGHQLLAVERATDAAGRPAIRLLIRKVTS